MSSDLPGAAHTPRIIVLTAPSGSGKTTIARRLRVAFPNLNFSVSATTRKPRQGETDGIDYHFLSPTEFRARIDRGDLVEYEEVYPDRFYGTLREAVDVATTVNPVLLDIDVKGADRVRRLFGADALVIFVKPPSLEVLKERLMLRDSDSSSDIDIRLKRSAMELRWADRFDRTVVNDDLDRAAAEAIQLVTTFLSHG